MREAKAVGRVSCPMDLTHPHYIHTEWEGEKIIKMPLVSSGVRLRDFVSCVSSFPTPRNFSFTFDEANPSRFDPIK